MASYAVPAELRAQIDMTTATKDADLQAVLDGATRTINRVCNRPDGFVASAAAEARHYVGNGKNYLLIDECVEITEVAVKDSVSDTTFTAWTTPTTNMSGDGDWYAGSGDPLSPDFNHLPYNMILADINGDYTYFTNGQTSGLWGFRYSPQPLDRGIATVRVTARWGYADEVPDDIKQACITQAARWWKRAQSAWSDVLASGEMGTLLYRQTIDPAVKLMLIEGRYIVPTHGGIW